MNNNLSPIPFYSNLEEQDFRLWYSYGQKYPHYVPNDYLVPFYFIIPFHYNNRISHVYLYRSCGCGDEIVGVAGDYNEDFNADFFNMPYLSDFTQTFDLNGLTITPYEDRGYTLVTYFATPNEALNLKSGAYYIEIGIRHTVLPRDMTRMYSDIFFVDTPENLKNKVKVEWYDQEDLEYEGGVIPYSSSYDSRYYKNIIYLDTTIGKPNYNFTEEGEERDGYFFPFKQISEKVYNMDIIAPEYLCDLMRTIRMADAVKITDNLGRVYKVDQFEMDVNWQGQGHYAEVGCSFQTDTIVKKIGKAYTGVTER